MSGSQHLILVCDDELSCLISVEELLKDTNNVRCVQSVQAAKDFLKTTETDLLLLDVNLDRPFDGLLAIESFRQISENRSFNKKYRLSFFAKCVIQEKEVKRLSSPLSVIPIETVPLRKRKEDIKDLAEEFLLNNDPNLFFSDDTPEMLQSYNWPGNIRELQNTVAFVATFCDEDEIVPEDLPDKIKRLKVERSNLYTKLRQHRVHAPEGKKKHG